MNCAYVKMNYRPQQNHNSQGADIVSFDLPNFCWTTVRRSIKPSMCLYDMYCLQFLLLSVPGNAVMVLSVAVSLELWRSRLETSGHQCVSAVNDITPWRQHPNNFLFGSRAEKLQSLADCLAKFTSARYGPPFLFQKAI